MIVLLFEVIAKGLVIRVGCEVIAQRLHYRCLAMNITEADGDVSDMWAEHAFDRDKVMGIKGSVIGSEAGEGGHLSFESS